MSEKEKNMAWLNYVTREDFIELVHRMGADQGVEYWLQKHPSDSGPALKKAAHKIVQLSDPREFRSLGDKEKNDWWQNIEAKTLSKKSKGRVLSLSNWRRWGIAASIALLMGLGWMFYQNTAWTHVQMASAEKSEIELPDGSVVEINASSEISYKSRSFVQDRRIRLEGEAFFEVKSGSSFTVETSMGAVRVLGTAFNVRQRENSFHVSCQSGKVEVVANGQKTILSKGEATRYTEEEAELGKYLLQDPAQIASWRQGRYMLNNVRYEEAVRELERQFDIQIEVAKTLRSKKGNFYFTGSDLDSALYQLSWPLNADYREKEDGKYEIYMNK